MAHVSGGNDNGRGGAHGGHGGGGDAAVIYPSGATYAEHHHSHFIMPLATLRLVLTALLVFTFLTVGATELEKWISAAWHVEMPQWINVSVALSIAVIKTALVVLFFMQLKYDNPLNALVFIFTLVTVAFFLGFTMLDLGNRATIDTFKAQYIVPGGTGLENAGKSIAVRARDAAIANGDYHPEEHMHGHEEAAPEPLGSTAARSRPVQGLTLPGFGAAQPAPAEQGGADAKH